MGSVGSTSQGSTASAGMAETNQEADKISFVLDASGEGCSGMFWRSKPEMNATAQASDWPRNGTKLKGWMCKQNPGWVKIDHPKGYYLPVVQNGVTIIHFDRN